MSKLTKQKNMTKSEFYQHILTDPFFDPATKVLLMYLLELKGVYYIENAMRVEDINWKEEIGLSDRAFKRAVKQLKEVGLITNVTFKNKEDKNV